MKSTFVVLLALSLSACHSLPVKVAPAPCPQPVQIPASLMQPPETSYLLAPEPG